MFPHLLKIQIAMTMLVCIGGYVLGSSLGDIYIITASIMGAAVAFVVVDRLGWVDLSGWVANVVLLFVLFYSMQSFVGGGSTAKLVAVANLLAYLQITLIFQKKTPRLCWQILVLSILQMIVAAIFNLNFEYGLLFVLYFAVISCALVLQSDFQEWTRAKIINDQHLKKLDKGRWVPATVKSPIVYSRLQPTKNLVSYLWLLLPWCLASMAFAFILFHSLPHQRQDWQSPSERRFTATGKSKVVDLNIDSTIPVSNSLIFRARFIDPNNGENLILNVPPYFRGMALNRWTINNGATSWEAPYDHVFAWSSYLNLDRFKHDQATIGNVSRVGLEIILEPVSDPLLYSTMPTFRPTASKTEVEFCRDLSALTRRRVEQANDIASYKYKLTTLIDKNNRTLTGWPYIQFRRNKRFVAMEDNSPEFQLLTQFDTDRYPGLIEISNQIANRNLDKGRLELCDAFLAHFSKSNGFDYTLDYRNVDRDLQLDPIEDFVGNHRQGHCEFYASALTLMLRSQGIPARYVVGFHGGVYNNLTNCYVIHGRHAHAWVEAYIPPAECTQEMFAKSIAGPGGAWITLDPTPAVDSGRSNEAFDLARSIWQDYVISPDHNKQNYNGANGLLMASAQDSHFGLLMKQSVEKVQTNRRVQLGLMSIVLMFVLLVGIKNRISQPTRKRRSSAENHRGFLSRAVSYVSPQLAHWIDGTPTEIAFYRRLERVVQSRLGLQRQPHQTQREFATMVAHEIDQAEPGREAAEPAKNVLENVTNAFYQARFGSTPLDKMAVEEIENQIQNLDRVLKRSS